jgi:hypothetical protein
MAGQNDPILGIDCHSFPGEQAIEVLGSQHGFRIVGLYLTHAPGKPDMTWIGKRPFLAGRGWGFLPTYLGSQAAAPAAAAGSTDGQEAVHLMAQAGFAAGAVVYLDIETPKVEQQFGPYLGAWMAAVRAGGFYPGVYGSYTMAPWLTKLTSAVWTVELPISKHHALTTILGETAITGALSATDGAEGPGTALSPEALVALSPEAFVAVAPAYNPALNPHGLIRPGCIATQYLWYQTFQGLPLDPGIENVFDLDASLVADPSNPEMIRQALGLQTLIG